MAFKNSFPVIINEEAEILILGSLPGDLSIAKQAYYAHPQNRFWKLMAKLFNQELSDSYPERVQLLQDNRIALWDVCKSAYREGSMDTAIQEVEANAIHELISSYPKLKKIVFNGQKAMKLYDKHLNRIAGIDYYCMPSTSPANASYNLERLMESWGEILTND